MVRSFGVCPQPMPFGARDEALGFIRVQNNLKTASAHKPCIWHLSTHWIGTSNQSRRLQLCYQGPRSRRSWVHRSSDLLTSRKTGRACQPSSHRLSDPALFRAFCRSKFGLDKLLWSRFGWSPISHSVWAPFLHSSEACQNSPLPISCMACCIRPGSLREPRRAQW